MTRMSLGRLAGVAVFALTVGIVAPGAPAGAAVTASWPTPTAQVPVGATIKLSGTTDEHLKRYYGVGDLGTGGQDEDQYADLRAGGQGGAEERDPRQPGRRRHPLQGHAAR